MIYSTYDRTTGQILSTISNSEDTIPENTLAGAYNDKEHYFDIATQTIMSKPSKPSSNHTWNWNSKSWLFDNEYAGQNIRQLRNTLLLDVDRVNPVWYNSLTDSQKQEIADYRTALLNVPQQSGFPAGIEWPTRPTWL